MSTGTLIKNLKADPQSNILGAINYNFYMSHMFELQTIL